LGDYSTLGATPFRTGNNGDAANTGPGRSYLRWHFPNGANVSTVKPIIDDTDTNPPSFSSEDGGPFDANPYGYTTLSGSWTFPADVFSEASGPYDPAIRVNQITYNGSVFQPNFDARFPAYHMASCCASSATDPTVRATNANPASDFNWIFTGSTTVPENYAVWVNIPGGPTAINGLNVFAQQYFVFEIDYGPNGSSRFVDVVNTFVSGTGWVRLGNGGMPTNVVFPWDGADPIRVTLHNTVPRDSTGALTMPGSDPLKTSPAVDGMSQYYVYADAVRFDPTPGFSFATPTATRLNDTDPNTTIVTAATNELSVGLQGGVATAPTNGVVRNFNFGTGAPTWRYSPLE
jgi:hypothetical protein